MAKRLKVPIYHEQIQENKLAEINFTYENRWPVLITSNFIPLDQIQRALLDKTYYNSVSCPVSTFVNQYNGISPKFRAPIHTIAGGIFTTWGDGAGVSLNIP